MGNTDPQDYDDAMQSIARSTQESDMFINLPKANDILPRLDTFREGPLFVVGHKQINIGLLDGHQPEVEPLLHTSKSELIISPSKFSQNKSPPPSIVSEQNKQAHKSPMSATNVLLSSVRIPPPTAYLQLNSLLDKYSLVYNKFSQKLYDSFNVMQFQKSDLQNAKQVDFLEDSLLEKTVDYDKNNQSKPIIKNPNQTIKFDSRFECGNLSMAFEQNQRSYILLMQNDTNSFGCTQWFFFRVENGKTKGEIDFEIVNFQKSSSLFTQGMKVLIHSQKKRNDRSKQLGWHRGCTDITYTANRYTRQREEWMPQIPYYSLRFTYDFQDEDDCVYFAYNYPYSYSRLQNEIAEITKCPRRGFLLKQSLLCRTLAGNRVDLLTVSEQNLELIEKQTIVISARVHPGETVSSFMMKGFIDKLLEDSKEARWLRQNFIFKIIPMINPDGVIHGNYRCSLAGKDLNRQWKKPSKNKYPEIHALKQLILNTTNLALFCDLHGHSIKKNIFVYGCHEHSNPSACRELPLILSKMYEPFSFNDCNFNVKSEKEGTARVSLWNRLRLPNIFTLESSFCGPSYSETHFGVPDFERMGQVLCGALCIYFEQTPNDDKKEEQAGNNQDMPSTSPILLSKQEIQKELLNNIKLLTSGLDESAGSDSCPSEDDLQKSPKKTILIPSSSVVIQPPKTMMTTPSSPTKRPIRKLQQQLSFQLKPTIQAPIPEQQEEPKVETPPEPSNRAVLIIPPKKTNSMLKLLDNNSEYKEENAFDSNKGNLSSRIFTLNFIGRATFNAQKPTSADSSSQDDFNETTITYFKCPQTPKKIELEDNFSPLKIKSGKVSQNTSTNRERKRKISFDPYRIQEFNKLPEHPLIGDKIRKEKEYTHSSESKERQTSDRVINQNLPQLSQRSMAGVLPSNSTLESSSRTLTCSPQRKKRLKEGDSLGDSGVLNNLSNTVPVKKRLLVKQTNGEPRSFQRKQSEAQSSQKQRTKEESMETIQDLRKPQPTNGRTEFSHTSTKLFYKFSEGRSLSKDTSSRDSRRQSLTQQQQNGYSRSNSLKKKLHSELSQDISDEHGNDDKYNIRIKVKSSSKTTMKKSIIDQISKNTSNFI